MKKCLLLLVLFISIKSFSQVNLRTGFNLSDYTNTETKKRASFYIGVQLPINFGGKYTLQPEVNYSQQGAIFYFDNIKHNLFSNYINTAIVHKYKISKKMDVFIAPYLAFRINKGVSRANGSSGWLSLSPDINLFIPMDIGISIGFEYIITTNFTAELRYKQGIMDVLDLRYFDDDLNIRKQETTQVFQIGVIYKLNFKTKK